MVKRGPRKSTDKTVIPEKMVDGWVDLFARGEGEPITTIADAYKTTVAAVRYHLKKRGELDAKPEDANPESGTMEFNETDDADLGIGDPRPEQAAPVSLDALMSDPRFEQLLEAAVAAKMKAMGQEATAPGAAESLGGPAQAAKVFEQYLSRFEHLLEARDQQQPGFIKPLTADELDARRDAKVEMFALLGRMKREGRWPQYVLSDDSNPFYGDSPMGLMLYSPGQTINTRKPPAECFRPVNDAAIEVFTLYKRWVGQVVTAEELLRQAAMEAMGARSPEFQEDLRTAEPEVMLVDAPLVDVGAKRVLGTLVPEVRGRNMPKQPGISDQPLGPIFVEG